MTHRLRSLYLWAIAGFLLVGMLLLPANQAAEKAAEQTDFADIQPLIERYCFECHSGDLTEADIDLAAYKSLAEIRKAPKTWIKVRQMINSHQMPPKEAKQPSDAERLIIRNWVHAVLMEEAQAHAGDPGPVLLRRLSNAEYTNTVRDLTGVESLDPTREFPVDGAAGEGFTNTGSGQGMSPALLQKYLDAAKEVAAHTVLLPDGIAFSPHTTPRDHTDAWLAKIQSFYRQFTEDGAGTAIDLQGIRFTTNQGGLLPLEAYLTATLAERERLQRGETTLGNIARDRGLNAKYLGLLWKALNNSDEASSGFLLDSLRARWRKASPKTAPALLAKIAALQKQLWKFNTIGHIGREGSPSLWMEPISPIAAQKAFRLPLPESPPQEDITLTLVANDLGDGNLEDFVTWQNPRIEFKTGEPASISLCDLPLLAGQVEQFLVTELPKTKSYMQALTELHRSPQSVESLAKSHGLNAELLANWAELVGINQKAKREVPGLFTQKHAKVNGYEAINGWGRPETPSMLTNRSNQPITLSTLTVPARGVTVHPSPTLDAVAAWKSPVAGAFKVEVLVADADNKCGNGAGWQVELQTDTGRSILAEGIIDNGQQQRFQPNDQIEIAEGDILSVIVSARDNNHVCDTTHIELKFNEVGGNNRVWNLAEEVVDHILDNNPLPDAQGHSAVWHFAARPHQRQQPQQIPEQSALAEWRISLLDNKPQEDTMRWANLVQEVLLAENFNGMTEPNRQLRSKLLQWRGPLGWLKVGKTLSATPAKEFEVPGITFGKHPQGRELAKTDLGVKAPQRLEIRLPAGLVVGGEIVTMAALDPNAKEGSVQAQAALGNLPSEQTDNNMPVLVNPGSAAEKRVQAAYQEFRDLFPPALCYARIVPVDEVVTLTLYYREDDHLQRLMLERGQQKELNRLWAELVFISQEPLKKVVALEQITEFATQDRADLVPQFRALKQPTLDRAEVFRKALQASEPAHLQAVLEFANRAWRRPLQNSEEQSLKQFYAKLRNEDMPHLEAIQLLLVRVLTTPAFLYKLEQPVFGPKAGPVSSTELASRLSYFLWSSLPDSELRQLAGLEQLQDENILRQQTRRLLSHSKTRRLAVQFACQWLHVRDFDQNNDKNETLYPEFASLRGDMYEETVRFFTEMFQKNGSILDVLNANHTFLNESLARHYGVSGIAGSDWQRMENLQAQGRGGVLGMATFLASQSGASRTSPILRGNWIYETLLGERLPRPPANVPQLPETLPEGLTARQLIERHSSDPACAKCHAQIDPYGFALEQFDALGKLRPQSVDTKTTLPNGRPIEGLSGLRNYLVEERQEDFVKQFCRKLLGFALGRELQLSDEPLIEQMQSRLKAEDYRFQTAVELIVSSPQFRNIRGQAHQEE